MFDELKTIVSHLREVSSRINVDVIDGKSAAELVRISEDARRVIDGLRTSAIGRVGTTEAWRVGGSNQPEPARGIPTERTIIIFPCALKL